MAFRFEVAFSFAGPHREKVRVIAELVAAKLGRDKVFFDEWYEHEILGSDMDVLLQSFYHRQSLMVVADLSEDYADRKWTQAEARAIRALRTKLDTARDETARLRLLNIRLGEGDVPGVYDNEGYLDGVNKSVEQCAEVILKRQALLVQRMAAQPLLSPDPAVAPAQAPETSLPVVVCAPGLGAAHLTSLVPDASDQSRFSAVTPFGGPPSDAVASKLRPEDMELLETMLDGFVFDKAELSQMTLGQGIDWIASCLGLRYPTDLWLYFSSSDDVIVTGVIVTSATLAVPPSFEIECSYRPREDKHTAFVRIFFKSPPQPSEIKLTIKAICTVPFFSIWDSNVGEAEHWITFNAVVEKVSAERSFMRLGAVWKSAR